METNRGFASINGAEIYYETSGSGIPIVFMHGFGLDTRMWDDQFYFFSRNFRVVRYDLRGFGKSSLPTSSPYSHTDDLRALLDFLKIDRACILGLSLGGRWAIQFALDYQDRAEALIKADAVPNGFQFRGESPAFSKNILERAAKEGVNAAKEAWFHHSIFENTRKNPELSSCVYEMTLDYSGWHWCNRDPVIIPDPAVSRLNEIRVPALILVGELDMDDFKRAAEWMNQQIPKAQKFEIPGVGHMSNMEGPKRFNEILFDFLSSIFPFCAQ